MRQPPANSPSHDEVDAPAKKGWPEKVTVTEEQPLGHWHRGREPGFPGPPAQIRTCALTHTAPTSGRDGRRATACRIWSAACDTVVRSCARAVLWRPGLPLVPALRSTNSARPEGPLFAGFITTMAESDFFKSFISGYGYFLSFAAPHDGGAI